MANKTKTYISIVVSLATSCLPSFLHRRSLELDFLSIETINDFKT